MASTERFGFNIVEEEDFSREPKPLVDWQRNITDNFKNIDENCAKESDLEKIRTTTFVTTANTNLNDYIENGFYFFNIANTPTNKPSGVSNLAGYLEVIARNTNDILQIWTEYGNSIIWVRQKEAGNWTGWHKIELADKRGGIELLYDQEITTGTAVTITEDIRNFRFIQCRLTGGRNYVLCPINPNWFGFRGVQAYGRIGTGGNFELMSVRGSCSGTSLTVDDAGQLIIAPNGTITQNAFTVSEVWGIR